MHLNRIITTIDTHTAGEPTRVVTGGVPHIPGTTMQAKKQWMAEHEDDLRKMLMWEPRGHRDMFGAIITAPASEGADMGVIYMDNGGYLDMCVHGSIGAVTAMIDSGILNNPPATDGAPHEIVLDTPAGKVSAYTQVEDGRVKSVTIRNVPSFFYDSLEVDLNPFGRVPISICFAGNYFAIVNVEALKTTVEQSNIGQLIEFGMLIREQANREIKIVHPATGERGRVNLVEFCQETSPPRNLVIFGSGQADRSPCGTGTGAKMALLHHQDKLAIGTPFRYQSIIGTEFTGEILEETQVGDRPAIIPAVTGRAHIIGLQNFVIDEEDPFKHGFGFSKSA